MFHGHLNSVGEQNLHLTVPIIKTLDFQGFSNSCSIIKNISINDKIFIYAVAIYFQILIPNIKLGTLKWWHKLSELSLRINSKKT